MSGRVAAQMVTVYTLLPSTESYLEDVVEDRHHASLDKFGEPGSSRQGSLCIVLDARWQDAETDTV